MGDSQRKGLAYLADAADGPALLGAYKEAKNAVRHQAQVEQDVIRSASILFTKPDDGKKKLEPLASLVSERASTLQEEVTAFYKLQAEQKKIKTTEPKMTNEEREAARTYYERPEGQGGGFGRMRAAMANLNDAERASLGKIPQHMTAELNILVGKKKSLLEIRDFLSGEFEPLALADLMEYAGVMEKMGMLKKVSK